MKTISHKIQRLEPVYWQTDWYSPPYPPALQIDKYRKCENKPGECRNADEHEWCFDGQFFYRASAEAIERIEDVNTEK